MGLKAIVPGAHIIREMPRMVETSSSSGGVKAQHATVRSGAGLVGDEFVLATHKFRGAGAVLHFWPLGK